MEETLLASARASATSCTDEPHVLIFPLPLQGPVNSMLKLAELLLISGLHVTFLNSEHNHRRLLLHTDIQSRFSRYPRLNLETIPDGLPADHPRSGERVMEMVESIKNESQHLFREMLASYRVGSGKLPPVSCVIADGIFGFAVDVAEEIGVRHICFRTISAVCFWAYFCLPQLIQSGEVPFDDGQMDKLVTSVSGMESFLRRRDLPSFFRTKHLPDATLDTISTEMQYSIKSDALIFNTFEELDGPILAQICRKFPNVYAIGPLHAHLESKLQHYDSSSPNSLWEVDRTCLTWLDSQPLKSVIYVSFGSITIITKSQFMEIWYGLMNSSIPFLWVIRPESIAGEREIPGEVAEGTKGRGYIVGWAPQEEVLAHRAVGGFFTHSGWNSTIESIVAGVPMICWPHFVDQQINSRFASEVWNLGLDMKDVCDRVVVEKMAKDLMELRKDEFAESADRMAEIARKCLSEGGSSLTLIGWSSIFDRSIHENIRDIGPAQNMSCETRDGL